MTFRLTVAVAVSLASCGGSVASAPPTTCGAYAEAYCAKEESCANTANITRNWGDFPTCVTRETLACTDALSAPDTGQTASLVSQCTAALPTYTCNDFLTNNLPVTCNPLGPRVSGAACTFNAQCASGYCSNIRYGTCGTCADPPATGSSCARSTCGHGQDCVWNAGLTNVCQTYVASGSACGAFQNPPCLPDVACAGASSTTGATGICRPPVSTVGAACGSATVDLNCDGTKGLWCVHEACIQVTYASDGMPCGHVDGGVVECTAGTCYSSAGPYFDLEGPTTGVCKAFAADGAACDTRQGPGCMSAARCVTNAGTTSGICTVPTASVAATCG